MDRYALYSGSKFEDLAGYSRALVAGEWIFVSGTAGYDPGTGTFAVGAAEQTRRALQTIAESLEKAGSSLADVVQVRVYLAERADVMPVCEVLGQTFSDPRPTNTTILCGFPVEEIKVEIEVTAKRRGAPAA